MSIVKKKKPQGKYNQVVCSTQQFTNENSTKLINYLKKYGKNETKSLSKEEERKLIDEYLETNPDKLKELLVVHNIKLVFKFAKKYVTITKDFDELVARGLEGLVYATTLFNYKKDIKFSTYASRWIKKRILEEFRTRESKSKRRKKLLEIEMKNKSLFETTLSQYDLSNDHNDFSLSSNTSDSSSTVQAIYNMDKEYLAKEIEGLVDNQLDLTQDEKTVYTRMILDTEPAKHVAKDLNLSVHNTMKMKNKIVSDIQTALEEKFNCKLDAIY